MTVNNNASNTPQLTCPYLGMQEDVESHLAFTSPLNHCHRGKSPAPVRFDQQENFCLDSSYSSCPVYQDGQGKPFPRELRARGKVEPDHYPGRRRNPWVVNFLILIALVLVIGYFWNSQDEISFPGVITSTPIENQSLSLTPLSTSDSPLALALSNTPTQIVDPFATPSVTPFPTLTLTPTETATITLTPTITRTPTVTRTPTSTYTPTATVDVDDRNQLIINDPSIPVGDQQRMLDTPIGPDQKFLIHKVLPGDNLTYLASLHNTTIDAIQVVNFTLEIPIWDGALIVIPIDISNPAGLPVFEPYQVEHESISVEQLAALLNTDPGQFKYFNVLEDGEILQEGEWVLVPRAPYQ